MKQPRNDACGLYFKYQERVQSGDKKKWLLYVIDWYEFIYLYINFFLLSAYVSIFACEFYQISMGGCQTKTYTMTM